MFKKKLKKNANRWLITKLNPKSVISEQYRSIRTNIQFSGVDQEIKSILVTSTDPEEGKSTTVANLAVVYAQQGKKVLLVDADLRLPSVHHTFQAPNMMGLTNVLTKQKPFAQAVFKTDIKNLDVLSSGPIPPNPSELMGSQAMSEFLQMAVEEYDLVLFDTPPLLAVADAQILANICEASILVVGSGKTAIDKLSKAKDHLLAAKAKLLGGVLNNQKMEKHNYYYYGEK